MLFFKKPKIFLRDMLPNYMDIHSHLLFGIDDGAKTFEDTLFLTNSLMEFGTTAFITTPHTIAHVWENTRDGIIARNGETTRLLVESNVNTPFRSASEYLMDSDFVNRFNSEPLLTLKDNYVLVEMSYVNAPIQLYDILFDLQIAGYIPVLAHPERYVFYHNNFDEYIKLKNVGCLFQLNLLAVTGFYGSSVTKIAEQLLQKGMYDFA